MDDLYWLGLLLLIGVCFLFTLTYGVIYRYFFAKAKAKESVISSSSSSSSSCLEETLYENSISGSRSFLSITPTQSRIGKSFHILYDQYKEIKKKLRLTNEELPTEPESSSPQSSSTSSNSYETVEVSKELVAYSLNTPSETAQSRTSDRDDIHLQSAYRRQLDRHTSSGASRSVDDASSSSATVSGGRVSIIAEDFQQIVSNSSESNASAGSRSTKSCSCCTNSTGSYPCHMTSASGARVCIKSPSYPLDTSIKSISKLSVGTSTKTLDLLRFKAKLDSLEFDIMAAQKAKKNNVPASTHSMSDYISHTRGESYKPSKFADTYDPRRSGRNTSDTEKLLKYQHKFEQTDSFSNKLKTTHSDSKILEYNRSITNSSSNSTIKNKSSDSSNNSIYRSSTSSSSIKNSISSKQIHIELRKWYPQTDDTKRISNQSNAYTSTNIEIFDIQKSPETSKTSRSYKDKYTDIPKVSARNDTSEETELRNIPTQVGCCDEMNATFSNLIDTINKKSFSNKQTDSKISKDLKYPLHQYEDNASIKASTLPQASGTDSKKQQNDETLNKISVACSVITGIENEKMSKKNKVSANKYKRRTVSNSSKASARSSTSSEESDMWYVGDNLLGDVDSSCVHSCLSNKRPSTSTKKSSYRRSVLPYKDKYRTSTNKSRTGEIMERSKKPRIKSHALRTENDVEYSIKHSLISKRDKQSPHTLDISDSHSLFSPSPERSKILEKLEETKGSARSSHLPTYDTLSIKSEIPVKSNHSSTTSKTDIYEKSPRTSDKQRHSISPNKPGRSVRSSTSITREKNETHRRKHSSNRKKESHNRKYDVSPNRSEISMTSGRHRSQIRNEDYSQEYSSSVKKGKDYKVTPNTSLKYDIITKKSESFVRSRRKDKDYEKSTHDSDQQGYNISPNQSVISLSNSTDTAQVKHGSPSRKHSSILKTVKKYKQSSRPSDRPYISRGRSKVSIASSASRTQIRKRSPSGKKSSSPERKKTLEKPVHVSDRRRQDTSPVISDSTIIKTQIKTKSRLRKDSSSPRRDKEHKKSIHPSALNDHDISPNKSMTSISSSISRTSKRKTEHSHKYTSSPRKEKQRKKRREIFDIRKDGISVSKSDLSITSSRIKISKKRKDLTSPAREKEYKKLTHTSSRHRHRASPKRSELSLASSISRTQIRRERRSRSSRPRREKDHKSLPHSSPRHKRDISPAKSEMSISSNVSEIQLKQKRHSRKSSASPKTERDYKLSRRTAQAKYDISPNKSKISFNRSSSVIEMRNERSSKKHSETPHTKMDHKNYPHHLDRQRRDIYPRKSQISVARSSSRIRISRRSPERTGREKEHKKHHRSEISKYDVSPSDSKISVNIDLSISQMDNERRARSRSPERRKDYGRSHAAQLEYYPRSRSRKSDTRLSKRVTDPEERTEYTKYSRPSDLSKYDTSPSGSQISIYGNLSVSRLKRKDISPIYSPISEEITDHRELPHFSRKLEYDRHQYKSYRTDSPSDRYSSRSRKLKDYEESLYSSKQRKYDKSPSRSEFVPRNDSLRDRHSPNEDKEEYNKSCHFSRPNKYEPIPSTSKRPDSRSQKYSSSGKIKDYKESFRPLGYSKKKIYSSRSVLSFRSRTSNTKIKRGSGSRSYTQIPDRRKYYKDSYSPAASSTYDMDTCCNKVDICKRSDTSITKIRNNITSDRYPPLSENAKYNALRIISDISVNRESTGFRRENEDNSRRYMPPSEKSAGYKKPSFNTPKYRITAVKSRVTVRNHDSSKKPELKYHNWKTQTDDYWGKVDATTQITKETSTPKYSSASRKVRTPVKSRVSLKSSTSSRTFRLLYQDENTQTNNYQKKVDAECSVFIHSRTETPSRKHSVVSVRTRRNEPTQTSNLISDSPVPCTEASCRGMRLQYDGCQASANKLLQKYSSGYKKEQHQKHSSRSDYNSKYKKSPNLSKESLKSGVSAQEQLLRSWKLSSQISAAKNNKMLECCAQTDPVLFKNSKDKSCIVSGRSSGSSKKVRLQPLEEAPQCHDATFAAIRHVNRKRSIIAKRTINYDIPSHTTNKSTHRSSHDSCTELQCKPSEIVEASKTLSHKEPCFDERKYNQGSSKGRTASFRESEEELCEVCNLPIKPGTSTNNNPCEYSGSKSPPRYEIEESSNPVAHIPATDTNEINDTDHDKYLFCHTKIERSWEDYSTSTEQKDETEVLLNSSKHEISCKGSLSRIQSDTQPSTSAQRIARVEALKAKNRILFDNLNEQVQTLISVARSATRNIYEEKEKIETQMKVKDVILKDIQQTALPPLNKSEVEQNSASSKDQLVPSKNICININDNLCNLLHRNGVSQSSTQTQINIESPAPNLHIRIKNTEGEIESGAYTNKSVLESIDEEDEQNIDTSNTDGDMKEDENMEMELLSNKNYNEDEVNQDKKCNLMHTENKTVHFADEDLEDDSTGCRKYVISNKPHVDLKLGAMEIFSKEAIATTSKRRADQNQNDSSTDEEESKRQIQANNSAFIYRLSSIRDSDEALEKSYYYPKCRRESAFQSNYSSLYNSSQESGKKSSYSSNNKNAFELNNLIKNPYSSTKFEHDSKTDINSFSHLSESEINEIARKLSRVRLYLRSRCAPKKISFRPRSNFLTHLLNYSAFYNSSPVYQNLSNGKTSVTKNKLNDNVSTNISTSYAQIKSFDPPEFHDKLSNELLYGTNRKLSKDNIRKKKHYYRKEYTPLSQYSNNSVKFIKHFENQYETYDTTSSQFSTLYNVSSLDNDNYSGDSSSFKMKFPSKSQLINPATDNTSLKPQEKYQPTYPKYYSLTFTNSGYEDLEQTYRFRYMRVRSSPRIRKYIYDKYSSSSNSGAANSVEIKNASTTYTVPKMCLRPRVPLKYIFSKSQFNSNSSLQQNVSESQSSIKNNVKLNPVNKISTNNSTIYRKKLSVTSIWKNNNHLPSAVKSDQTTNSTMKFAPSNEKQYHPPRISDIMKRLANCYELYNSFLHNNTQNNITKNTSSSEKNAFSETRTSNINPSTISTQPSTHNKYDSSTSLDVQRFSSLENSQSNFCYSSKASVHLQQEHHNQVKHTVKTVDVKITPAELNAFSNQNIVPAIPKPTDSQRDNNIKSQSTKIVKVFQTISKSKIYVQPRYGVRKIYYYPRNNSVLQANNLVKTRALLAPTETSQAQEVKEPSHLVSSQR